MSFLLKQETFKAVIKNLLIYANTIFNKNDYDMLYNAYSNETNPSAKNILAQILQNIKIAKDTNRPLCQDTGIANFFLEIGCSVNFDFNIEKTIQEATAETYKENFYRKSLVSDAVFSRSNTKDNTPAFIHTKFTDNDEIKISVLVKGGGSENMSKSVMLSPADGIDGIKNFVINSVKNAGSKPCPPIRIGIGIGGTFDYCSVLAKKALLEKIKDFDIYEPQNEYEALEKELLEAINNLGIGVMGKGGKTTCFGVNILHAPCHIASLPVSISINCHSSRHCKAIIKDENIIYDYENYEPLDIKEETKEIKRLKTSDIDEIKRLKKGEEILLSGTVYTARDAAHKKLIELIEKNEELPIDLNNSIIFYAGPCPKNDEEIIGPVGPTTSSRMDKYTLPLLAKGLLASIGKGERDNEILKSMENFNSKYFTITGGVACLLQKCIKSAEIVAYEELGAEAIYKLEVENFPLICAI